MKLNIILLLGALIVGFAAPHIYQSVKNGSSSQPVAQGSVKQVPIKQVPVAPVYDVADNEKSVPDIQITTIDNKTMHLSDLLDHKILLNFWASWCTPCIVEMPQLLDVATNNPDMFVILLSSDLNEEALMRFVETLPKDQRTQDNVLIAWDEGGAITRNVFQTYQLPETVMIDDRGILRHKFVGLVDWEDDDILKIIERY